MLTRADGTFKRGADPADTPIHESVHLGTERTIVKPFGLTHWEKERMVDLICLQKFHSSLPGYSAQKSGDRKIDPYINGEALKDLPSSISRFVKDFPRQ